MAAKKVLLFIVEGMSDLTSLELMLIRYFKDTHVKVEVTHGDITSDIQVNSFNIVSKIGNIIKKSMSQNKFKKSDFLKVVHLIDMDGAYIDDSLILQDDQYSKPFYEIDKISVSNVDKIKIRNERKRQNINRICTMTTVLTSIPYEAYYMSCNLDHVLHNKLNISDEEKAACAWQFMKLYKDDLPGFVQFFNVPSYCVNTTLNDSWNFIKEKNHSLQRYTNFGLCLNR